MPAGRNTSPPQAAAPRAGNRALTLFFAVQFFCVIFLQKFAVPVGLLQIGVPFIAFYAGLAAMVLFSRVEISLAKGAAYALFFAAAVVSQMLTASSRFSTPSMLMTLALYLPMVLIWRVPKEEYPALLRPFQDFMIICAGIVFLQLAWQVVFGLGNIPSIEPYVPPQFLLHGYNYDAPITWGAKFVRPNGFFMLEPSFIAMFLACALILEIAYFRRLWRIGVYGLALVGTFGATGFLIMIIAAPFLIRRPTMVVALFSPVLIGLAVIALVATGMLDRVSELSNPNASGWQRIVAPMLQMGRVMSEPHHLLTGGGAGSLSKAEQSWPITKLALEYGVLTALAFMAVLTLGMMTSRNRPLFWALFVMFNMTGGYLLNHALVELFTLLCCVVVPTAPVERRSVRVRRPAAVALGPPAPHSG